eukprot:s2395_g11.t1
MKLLAWFQVSFVDKELPAGLCCRASVGFMILQDGNGQNMFFSAQCRKAENGKACSNPELAIWLGSVPSVTTRSGVRSRTCLTKSTCLACALGCVCWIAVGRFRWRYRSGDPGDHLRLTAFVLWCVEAVRQGDWWHWDCDGAACVDHSALWSIGLVRKEDLGRCLPNAWHHLRLLCGVRLGSLCSGHCGSQHGLLRLLPVLQSQVGRRTTRKRFGVRNLLSRVRRSVDAMMRRIWGELTVNFQMEKFPEV